MAESADASDLGSDVPGRKGSNPFTRTNRRGLMFVEVINHVEEIRIGGVGAVALDGRAVNRGGGSIRRRAR